MTSSNKKSNYNNFVMSLLKKTTKRQLKYYIYFYVLQNYYVGIKRHKAG